MKVKYDKEVDVLYISFSKNKIKESDEDKPGIVLDYDKQGSIVGIEILDASKKMKNPSHVEYEVAWCNLKTWLGFPTSRYRPPIFFKQDVKNEMLGVIFRSANFQIV